MWEDVRDAHQSACASRPRPDVVVGFVEPYAPRHEAQLKDLKVIPRHKVEDRTTTIEEIDVDAIIRREPRSASSTSWHTRTCLAAAMKRYEDSSFEHPRGGHSRDDGGEHPAPRDPNDAGSSRDGVRVRERCPTRFSMAPTKSSTSTLPSWSSVSAARREDLQAGRSEQAHELLERKSLDAARTRAPHRCGRSRREGHELSRAGKAWTGAGPSA